MRLRVIGDVHGCVNTPHPRRGTCYRDLIADVDWSVQLGDMAFNYTGLKGVGARHVFIPGNHDNYDNLPEQALPGYGMVMLGPWAFFHVRGEWSIDINQRVEVMRKSGCAPIWWPQEELNKEEMAECMELWREAKPDVIMSHGCPISISELVGNPGVWAHFGWKEKKETNTQLLLEYMLQEHQPKLWLFGHFHRNWERTIGKTTFRCIDELNYLDFNENWEIL